MRNLLGLVRLTLLAAASLAAAAMLLTPQAQADPDCVPASECCKVCSKGKACGNSCISESKNCHKGRGCACDAEEICD
jgi:hypothetical protein